MKFVLAITVFYSIFSTVLVQHLDNISDHLDDVGEYGDYFEGDMILTEEQKKALFAPTYNGVIASKYRWLNRTVPYEFSSDHSEEQQKYIRKALNFIESVSCLQFVKRTDEEDYIEIIDEGRGCWSYIGRIGGKQQLNLRSNRPGYGCFHTGVIIHEFLHALGFHHMQCTYDRDEYVKILWENIEPHHEHNFQKYTNAQVTNFNTTYDYYSIMHYDAYGFSTNGKPTIVPMDESFLNVIGQRQSMSYKDILKLNKMYECYQGADYS